MKGHSVERLKGESEMATMRKKPDIIVMLAVLIGMGVLVTELTYGSIGGESPVQQAQNRY